MNLHTVGGHIGTALYELYSEYLIYRPMAMTHPGLSVNGSHQKLILTQGNFWAKPSVASPTKESRGQTQITWINQTRKRELA